MKNKLLFLLMMPVYLLAQSGISDAFKISLSKTYQVVDAQEKNYFLIDDKIVMLKRDVKLRMGSFNQPIDLTVQVYDVEKKQEVKRTKHVHQDNTDIFEDIVLFPNRMFLLFSRWDANNQIEQLFCKEFNLETANFGNEKLLIQSQGKISRKDFSSIGKFTTYESFDKNKILVQFRKRPENVRDKINKDDIGLFVFDENFDLVWGKEVKMPYTEKQMDNVDYKLDNNGMVFLLTKVNEKARLLVYSEDNMQDVDISSNKYGLVNPVILNASDGQMYLVGSFCKICKSKSKWLNFAATYDVSSMSMADYVENMKYDSRFNTDIDGIFFAKLNNDLKLDKYSFFEIPLELVHFAENKKKIKKINTNAKKDQPLIPNLKLTKVIAQNDDSFVYFLEELVRNVKSVSDSKGNSSQKVSYKAESKYVIKIDTNGKLKWINKLPKNIVSPVSFTHAKSKSFYNNGKHYVFHVDHPKGVNHSIEELPLQYRRGYKGGIMVVYIIDDASGKLTKEVLFDFDKIPDRNNRQLIGYQFSTGRIQSTSTGFAFEIYVKNKNDQMVHVDFK